MPKLSVQTFCSVHINIFCSCCSNFYTLFIVTSAVVFANFLAKVMQNFRNLTSRCHSQFSTINSTFYFSSLAISCTFPTPEFAKKTQTVSTTTENNNSHQEQTQKECTIVVNSFQKSTSTFNQFKNNFSLQQIISNFHIHSFTNKRSIIPNNGLYRSIANKKLINIVIKL